MKRDLESMATQMYSLLPMLKMHLDFSLAETIPQLLQTFPEYSTLFFIFHLLQQPEHNVGRCKFLLGIL